MNATAPMRSSCWTGAVHSKRSIKTMSIFSEDLKPFGDIMPATRWERWMNRVRHINSDSVIVATHAGPIRGALARSGLRSDPSGLSARIPPGSVHYLNVG